MGKSGKRAAAIIILSVVIGFAAEYLQKQESVLHDGSINRNAPGEGDTIAVLEYQEEGAADRSQMELTISEQELTQQEWEAALVAGEQELDTLFLAENESISHIETKVNLCERVQNGLFSVTWQFSPDTLIDTQGNILEDYLEEEGQVVEVSATLTYHDYEACYTFPIAVYHHKKTAKEQTQEDILAYMNGQNPTDGQVILPERVNDRQISWSQPETYTAGSIILLGLAAAAGIIVGERYENNKRQKERNKKLLRDYPEIVSQLGLLLEAGMSLNQAWSRMIGAYIKKREAHQTDSREGYEQMKLTLHELQDGIGENAAFEKFGERCGLAQYRRLSAILSQNIRKGAAGIGKQLSKEAEDAFFQRKNQAERLGEEAGTKLLFPMMIMLTMVMAILVIPACMGMQV